MEKGKQSKESALERRIKEEKDFANAKDNIGEIMVYGTEDENGKRVKARITVETANGIIESDGKIPMSEIINKGGLKDNLAYKGVLKAYGNIFVNDLPKDYAELLKKNNNKKKKKKKSNNKKKKDGNHSETAIKVKNQNSSLSPKKKNAKKKW